MACNQAKIANERNLDSAIAQQFVVGKALPEGFLGF
jgi:hypothetical protein